MVAHSYLNSLFVRLFACLWFDIHSIKDGFITIAYKKKRPNDWGRMVTLFLHYTPLCTKHYANDDQVKIELCIMLRVYLITQKQNHFICLILYIFEHEHNFENMVFDRVIYLTKYKMLFTKNMRWLNDAESH